MNEIVILAVFYMIFMIMMLYFLLGRGIERAYNFHKDMYWGRLLGRKRYFLLSRSLAVVSLVGATIGCILVLIRKL